MKKLLLLTFVFLCNLVYGQDALVSIMQTIPALPTKPSACNTVTFHITATNNLSVSQSLHITLSVPGISTISNTSGPIVSSTVFSGVTNYFYDFTSVAGLGTVAFDVSYFIPCDFIPVNPTGLPGSYLTNIQISSTPTILPYTYSSSLSAIITEFEWTDLYYYPFPPTADLIAESHIGGSVTRSIRINCGTSIIIGTTFTGNIEFEDDRSGSCNMGDPQSVILKVYDNTGSLVSTTSGVPSGGGVYNWPGGISLPSNYYIVFTEVINVIQDPSYSIGMSRCLTDCSSSGALRSMIHINWGCTGTPMCHNIDVEALINKDALAPFISVTEVPAPAVPDVTCMDGTPTFITHTKHIENTGSTIAYDITAVLNT